jgi:hypothetical protein
MKNLINLLLILLLTSCQHEPTKSRFSKQISNFDTIIINHFPSKLKGMYRTAIFNDTQNDITLIMLLNQYDESDYNKYKDSLTRIAKVKYNPKDSCLLVVNMFTNEKNYFNSFKTKNKKYLKKECLNNKMPIPNFWAMNFNAQNVTKLPEDFKIYVFGASHKILDKKYISKNVYMPKNWKHGYSKGVAMNDKTHEIIYWFVLW